MTKFTVILKQAIATISLAVVTFGAALPTAAQPATPSTPEAPLTPTVYSLYAPLVFGGAIPPTIDLTIGAIDFTQATQTSINNVPLVAGRSTVVRVYAQKSTSDTVTGIRVSLSATRSGLNLPSSPLILGPSSIPSIWSRGNLSTSFNFQLPPDWLSGQVIFTAVVDSEDALYETNETNNTLTSTFTFNSVPVLNIVVVPVNYYDQGTKKWYPPAPTGYIAPYLVDMYPVPAVNVTTHSSINFSGRLLTSEAAWNSLLTQINNLRKSEGAAKSTVYYGVVPLLDTQGKTWFTGGIAGIGYYPSPRASVGLSDQLRSWGLHGDEIAAHEIGHNLGRDHAPCGVYSIDPYPYPGGVIGQYGFVMSSFQVVQPSVPDIMSYCDNPWISDYTYKGLYNDQRALSGSMLLRSAADSLWVRSSFDSSGKPLLEPVYSLWAETDTPPVESPYAVEFLDANDQVVASQVVQLLRADEPGISVRSISAIVPRPSQPFTALRLTYQGQPVTVAVVLAEAPSNQNRPALAPSARVVGQELTLNWGAPDTPALVRVSADGGQTWTLLGLDLLGGELRAALDSLPAGPLMIEVILAGGAPTMTLDWQP